jgi:predicted DNA-binding protein (MmcQ/YjbR family)
MEKMFVLVRLDTLEKGEQHINLKCDPENATELREAYEGIQPLCSNKKHWNTVVVNNSDVSDDMVQELIKHSYAIVVKGLTKKAYPILKDL